MRMNLVLRVAVGLGGLAALVGGCSSAPPEGTSDQSHEDLAIGGITQPNYCAYLPPLKTAVHPTNIPGLPDPATVRDCYQHVQGYEVAVPARVTSCRALYVPGIGFWYDATGTPGPSWDNAVPAWNSAASAHVCHYSFHDLYDFSWQASYEAGNSQAMEQTIAAGLCDALAAAGVPYTGVRYILPAYFSDVPEAPSIDYVTLPNGVRVPDFSNAFGQVYCPTVVGGCGSCVRQ